MKEPSGFEKRMEELEMLVSDLTIERDTLAMLAEKYKENVSVLSMAYATAHEQQVQALRLSGELTTQYREIARDRAETITHLLHGSLAPAGISDAGYMTSAEGSRIARLDAAIAKREEQLTSALKNITFNAARLLTGFRDGKFPEIDFSELDKSDYQSKLAYLAQIDKELGRLMSSNAYLLRANIAKRVGKTLTPKGGNRK